MMNRNDGMERIAQLKAELAAAEKEVKEMNQGARVEFTGPHKFLNKGTQGIVQVISDDGKKFIVKLDNGHIFGWTRMRHWKVLS